MLDMELDFEGHALRVYEFDQDEPRLVAQQWLDATVEEFASVVAASDLPPTDWVNQVIDEHRWLKKHQAYRCICGDLWARSETTGSFVHLTTDTPHCPAERPQGLRPLYERGTI